MITTANSSARGRSGLRGFLIATALLVLTGCGVAAPTHNAGYADVKVPRQAGMERDTTLSLGPRVMQFAARHVRDEPETAALIGAVDGVQIKVYRLTERVDHQALTGSINRAARTLKQDNWQPIVRVQEDNETAYVLLKQRDDTIVGIAVFKADREEFVFVNVMGALTPELIARVGRGIDDGNVLAFAADAVN